MKKIFLVLLMLIITQPVMGQMGMGMDSRGMEEIESIEDYFNLMMESFSSQNTKNRASNVEIDQENKTITQFLDAGNSNMGKMVMSLEEGKIVNRMYSDQDELVMETYMYQAYFNMVKNLQSKNRFQASEALAQSTLRTLSTASETFATANNGNYPVKMEDLTEATPPYLNTNFCGQEISKYSYMCEMSVGSYKFTAVPVDDASSDDKTFMITTGGILTEK